MFDRVGTTPWQESPLGQIWQGADSLTIRQGGRGLQRPWEGEGAPDVRPPDRHQDWSGAVPVRRGGGWETEEGMETNELRGESQGLRVSRAGESGIKCVLPCHVHSIYPQDPDFYKKRGNYHKKVVIACIAWIIFGREWNWFSIVDDGGWWYTYVVDTFLGFCISFITIRAFYGLHSRELELQNQINSNSLAESRANAKTYGSIEMQREMLFKKWTDDRKKRDSEFDE